jgi:hypothetical protein
LVDYDDYCDQDDEGVVIDERRGGEVGYVVGEYLLQHEEEYLAWGTGFGEDKLNFQ